MASIAVPTRIPRATSLGTLVGINNTARLNRMTRKAIINRPPILGKIGKSGKNGKTGRGAGKVEKCVSRKGRNWRNWENWLIW